MARDTTMTIGRYAYGARYALMLMALLFTAGATAQLFLAGLSTFDSALRWDVHVMLGRAISPLALALPVVAYVGRLGRQMLVLSAVVAVLYLAQVMLTYTGNRPIAALHAVNAIPLIALPVAIGLHVRRVLNEGQRARG